MPRAKILVSGVAGDIGFGAGRILREADWDGQLHGIDIHPDHPGSAVFDACSVAPRASEPSYIDWLSRYIVGCGIDVFIPTSEAEISRLTDERLDRVAGAVVLKANELTIRKSLDKNACLDFLSHAGVEVPAHGLLAQRQPDRYPVILKPRSGQGSKGIVRAERADQLPDARDSNLVWQEYLAPDHEEYTCGVFRSARVATRVLVMRRIHCPGAAAGRLHERPAASDERRTAAFRSESQAFEHTGVQRQDGVLRPEMVAGGKTGQCDPGVHPAHGRHPILSRCAGIYFIRLK